jgi:glycolate oxidase iron-sulfur subunit
MDLRIDPDELAACVSCGLCLPHCPTYRVTNDDTYSPRGRISLMRAMQDGGAPATPEIVESMETCVQCLGCETACPSGVKFGHLMEDTRAALATEGRITPWWQRLGLRALGHHRLLLAGSSLLAALQRTRLVPSTRFGLPARLPVRRAPLVASGDDVWLFTGCVMDAWQRDVHLAAQRVVEATGAGVRPTGELGPCCGALHQHAGLRDQAHAYAERVIRDLAGEAPILVDSAGCGAAMKHYGQLLDTDEARAFSARVFDVHEWLATRIDSLVEAAGGPAGVGSGVRRLDVAVAVQDPCHLRHVQRAHEPVRAVLSPFVRELVELDDEGLCCGAGGAYSVLQPELAGAIRERKLASIERSGGAVVASANPGCSMHLAAAGLDVRHPLEIVDAALRGAKRTR